MSTALSLKKYAFSVAVVVLAGCSGTQSQGITPNGIAPNSIAVHGLEGPVVTRRADHSRSWMLPEAKNNNLLYVSSDTEVNVYSYPKARLLGTLTGFQGAAYMCPDKEGNVWIPNFNGSTIVEYAHGGTQSIGILTIPKLAHPQGCAIDPTSGNLAVVGYPPPNSSAARVLVYTGAAGVPQVYRVRLATSSFCGYDNNGNLFVTGYGYGNSPFGVFELQKGAQKFRSVAFNPSGPSFSYEPKPVQWDGRHIAIGTPISIVRYDIDHFKGVKAGETTFHDLHQLADAWIQGGKIIVVNLGGQPPEPAVQIDKYPAGGKPIRTIDSGAGVTVSLAPR